MVGCMVQASLVEYSGKQWGRRERIADRRCGIRSRGDCKMSAQSKISRRVVLAGSAAFGTGIMIPRASAQSLEKITYLFPAPPVLPAFGPIRLAQGKGYFKDAGFEVEFAVGRGG